jgi:hypothetical protein
MKFIPHEDNWEREYFDSLKAQRKKKLAKKLKQINKWTSKPKTKKQKNSRKDK